MKKTRFVLIMALVLSLLVVSAASAQTLPPPSTPFGAGGITGTGGGSVQPVPAGTVIPPAPTGQQALSDPFLVAVAGGSSVTVCVDIPAGHHNVITLRFLGGDGHWHAVTTTVSGGQACGTFTVPSIVQLQGW